MNSGRGGAFTTYDLIELANEHARYKAALERIRRLVSDFGYFEGAYAATEAVRIAKEALEPPQDVGRKDLEAL